MAKHIFRGLIIILTFTLLMVFSAAPVLAFDARSGNMVTVPGGEVINDDLYVGANTVIIDGTINGDLWAAGNAITINGIVNGSVMAAGRTVNINGDVGHAVRAAGETIIINGDVSGDVIVGCSQVNIASTAKIGGDLLFGAGIARIDGLIEGDIKGGGSEVTISNGVKGNIALKRRVYDLTQYAMKWVISIILTKIKRTKSWVAEMRFTDMKSVRNVPDSD